jgi:hypothetical protein
MEKSNQWSLEHEPTEEARNEVSARPKVSIHPHVLAARRFSTRRLGVGQTNPEFPSQRSLWRNAVEL